MSVFINQAELLCAIGENANQRGQGIQNKPPLPEFLSFKMMGEDVSIPYHPISSYSIDQADRLYHIIDQLLEGFVSKLGLTSEELKRTALLLGSTSYDIGQSIALSRQANKPALEGLTPLTSIAHYIKNKFEFGGLVYSYNSACSSSANALHHAKLLLEQNIIDHAVVVGIELFNPASIGGFYSLQLLSPDQCQPFTASNGMVLGEAAGAVLLTKEKQAGALELQLINAAIDAVNITGAEESGRSLKAIMDPCLSVNTEMPAAIKSCGVGTGNADKAELNAIHSAVSKNIPLLAFKPFIGNTLGASGVAELVLLDDLLSLNVLPDYVFIHKNSLTTLHNKTLLLNSFGFGGNNVCLRVKHHVA